MRVCNFLLGACYLSVFPLVFLRLIRVIEWPTFWLLFPTLLATAGVLVIAAIILFVGSDYHD